MSEDDTSDIPNRDIEQEFETAEQMLADARTATEVDISKATIINRLYYACFHAAQAALYARGHNPQSHGQVQTLLGRELIQPGDVPRDLGRFLNDMETYRRRVDYGSGRVERDTQELIDGTSSFLDSMQKIIDVETKD